MTQSRHAPEVVFKALILEYLEESLKRNTQSVDETELAKVFKNAANYTELVDFITNHISDYEGDNGDYIETDEDSIISQKTIQLIRSVLLSFISKQEEK